MEAGVFEEELFKQMIIQTNSEMLHKRFKELSFPLGNNIVSDDFRSLIVFQLGNVDRGPSKTALRDLPGSF